MNFLSIDILFQNIRRYISNISIKFKHRYICNYQYFHPWQQLGSYTIFLKKLESMAVFQLDFANNARPHSSHLHHVIERKYAPACAYRKNDRLQIDNLVLRLSNSIIKLLNGLRKLTIVLSVTRTANLLLILIKSVKY